jgi:hypothetical protein
VGAIPRPPLSPMTQRTSNSSNYNRILYEVAVQRLLRFGESLGTPAMRPEDACIGVATL